MKPRIIVVALIAALGAGCASTDHSRMTYQVVPISTVTHGTINAASYYQLARYYHGQKRYDMAEAAYRKSISLDGNQVEALIALGSLYAERGDLERSVQQFERALAIAPDAAHLNNNLGFAYVLQGHMNKAYVAIRKALAIDPTLERGWANLERIARAQSDAHLAAVARARQTYSLPVALMAGDSKAVAIPLAVNTANPVTMVGEVNTPTPTTPAPIAPPVVQAELATTTPEPVISAIDRQEGEIQVAKREEIAVSVVTSSATQAVPIISAADAKSDDGKFVLVSTSREVVDLAEPAPVAPPESVTIIQENTVPVEKPEPVAIVSAEPIILAKAGPLTPAPEPVAAAALDPNAESAHEFDFAQIKVEVTNANGTTGFAKLFTAKLREDHIPVRRITNYANFLLKKTIIEFQPGFLDAAQALLHRTQLDAELSPAKEARFNSDVRIVLGHDAVSARKTILAKAP